MHRNACSDNIIRRLHPITFMYTIDNIELDNVEYYTDLVIAVSRTLLWDTHMSKTVKKCKQMCGMIKIYTGFHYPRNVQLSLYNTLVRRQIEYASPPWSPSHRRDICIVDSVQRSFTKYIFKYTDISYDKICKILNLLPLSYRREVNDIMVLI